MPERPFHSAAAALTAVHQGVELALGTGIIGQAQLGFPGALAASTVMDAGWFALAQRRRPPERLLAFGTGVAVGVPLVHFTLWPWKVRRGIPVLTEAEGLPPSAMGLYNAILYAWAAAGLLAVVRETPKRHRWWMAAGLASIAAIRPAAQAHFRWIEAESRRNPKWWNRAWGRRAVA